MSDTVEFYDGDSMVAQVYSSMVPAIGSKISIRKVVWNVAKVTYALDQADNIHEKAMRANVDLTRDA